MVLLDDQTIKNYENKYIEGGLDRLLTFDYKGGATKLTAVQEEEVKEHIKKSYYNDSKKLTGYIKGNTELFFQKAES